MGEGEKGIKRNTKIKKVHHSCINQKQNKERKSTSTGRHKKKKKGKERRVFMLAVKMEKQQKDKEDNPCQSRLVQGKNKETKTKEQGLRGYLNCICRER
jgi:hypothetical protein